MSNYDIFTPGCLSQNNQITLQTVIFVLPDNIGGRMHCNQITEKQGRNEGKGKGLWGEIYDDAIEGMSNLDDFCYPIISFVFLIILENSIIL